MSPGWRNRRRPETMPGHTADMSTAIFQTPVRRANGWRLDHSYSRLPDLLHKPWKLSPVRSPALVLFNRPLALSLGLDADALQAAESAPLFAGNTLPPGALPLAQAYAGHQFGGFTNLGDGRALLLGEQITPSGQRVDIQLKGSGATPFSRGGDGRAALGPMLREYIISEAMHALGIPTTRSLAVAATGEPVHRRETLQGAVLTRVAASHIRIGTFEFLSAHEDRDGLAALVNYTLERHFPDRIGAESPALELLSCAMERQASLVARWLNIGFVHGVMNTDNAALSGETIDYGPCAFMDRYDPATTFSSIDRGRRYAYANQPPIAQWNIARLAEALLPLLHPEETRALELANGVIEEFQNVFKQQWLSGMRSKLGLFNQEPHDETLCRALLDALEAGGEDFTNAFHALSSEPALQASPFETEALESWHASWCARRSRQQPPLADCLQLMRKHNPRVIPRNHMVEAALAAASTGDLDPTHRLLSALSDPYSTDPPLEKAYIEPAPPGCPPYKTFCGT